MEREFRGTGAKLPLSSNNVKENLTFLVKFLDDILGNRTAHAL